MYIYDLANKDPETVKGFHNIIEFQARYAKAPNVNYDTFEIKNGVLIN